MDDWLDRPNYCPPIAGYDGDVAVSVAARVDEAAPEAADDWMPRRQRRGGRAGAARKISRRRRDGHNHRDRTRCGLVRLAREALPRSCRRRGQHWRRGDRLRARVTAGFRHTATQPVAARAVGKAWPRAVHVVVVRVEKEVQASENVLTREEMYIFVLD